MMSREPGPTCRTLFLISLIYSKYTPAIFYPVSFSKNPTFTEQFPITNFCGKSPCQRI